MTKAGRRGAGQDNRDGRDKQAGRDNRDGRGKQAGRDKQAGWARSEGGAPRVARAAKTASRARVGGRATQIAPSRRALTARGLAISALAEVDRGERANEVLPALLAASTLDQRDRSFATELVYGTLRMRRACDWLVDRFARGELEPSVRAAARLGAYQLAFMRVPTYAAVSATVEESPRRARGLLNVVLRRIGELADAGPVAWPDLGTELSYPDWVIERLSEDLGRERALAALVQMNSPASAQAREDGYIQDPGSQAVGEVVAGWWDDTDGEGRPQQEWGEGEKAPDEAGRLQQGVVANRGRGVLIDLCAAPGGKATFLAGHAPLVVACDISPPRANRVAANVARLGLGNVAVAVADGNVAPFRPGSCGAVLLDAPCSGLGVLRRRPDARWRVRPEDVARLARLQRGLVASSASLVAPGGFLAYSVCTLTREETAGVGEWLASGTGPGASWDVLPPPGPPWEPLGRGALLLPQSAGTDGMYLIGLRRRG